jgi:D-arabinose 1-dehydrogenase-like Zn-dependent alcohol dehydrogenase
MVSTWSQLHHSSAPVLQVIATPKYCFSCLGLTVWIAYHAVDQCDLEQGQWVAVIGCGGLGHLGMFSQQVLLFQQEHN